MPELTPLSDNRKEHFLNGEVLEPLQTRREYYYAGREDELPPHQPTREELFIQKYRGGGGDVTVVPLSVTENGTYSEEGKAYSPVSVNVPLPTNAYLLKSVANLPQAIASFNDGEDMVMPSLKVAIEPQQDLHGYDAPWAGGAGKNKWEFNSSLSGNGNVLGGKVFTNQIPLGTYTLSSKGTFASGGAMAFRFVYTDDTTKDVTLGYNVQSGTYYVSAVFEKAVKGLSYVYSNNANNSINSIQLEQGETATSFAPYSNICPISGWDEVDLTVADDVENPTVYNVYTIDLDETRYGGEVDVVNGIVTPAPYYASYNGEALTGEWISDRDKYEVGATPTIGAQVVNIGASGTPVSILPTAIKSLRGVNNVWADTGDIKDAEYFSKEV